MLTKTTINGELLQANVLRIFDTLPGLLHYPNNGLMCLRFAQHAGTTTEAPLFLSTYHECYSTPHKIYHDGSKTASLPGCGIYVEHINIRQSITIKQYASSFSAALLGILGALYCIVAYCTRYQTC